MLVLLTPYIHAGTRYFQMPGELLIRGPLVLFDGLRRDKTRISLRLRMRGLGDLDIKKKTLSVRGHMHFFDPAEDAHLLQKIKEQDLGIPNSTYADWYAEWEDGMERPDFLRGKSNDSWIGRGETKHSTKHPTRT